jgi:hypothetical protein
MKAAVVPAVSTSWQIQDVPQPQPGPNQVLGVDRACDLSPKARVFACVRCVCSVCSLTCIMGPT